MLTNIINEWCNITMVVLTIEPHQVCKMPDVT